LIVRDFAQKAYMTMNVASTFADMNKKEFTKLCDF